MEDQPAPAGLHPPATIFIEQPRDTVNDTGRGTVRNWEGVQKSEVEHCLFSEAG